jgi:hypothetical protein
MKLVHSASIGALLLVTTPGLMAIQAPASNCKAVHAEMTESRSTTACRPGHLVCFLGEVDGNHGLRGTTYFNSDSNTGPMKTSPEFVGYSGIFEYTSGRGSLVARETGVSSGAQRAVTAYQRITEGTGEYTGATGYLFVSGQNSAGHIVTRVTGEICYP